MGKTIQIRTAPRAKGNYYDLAENTTHNVLLAARFPAGWTQHPNRFVFWQGPVLADAVQRQLLFSAMGATHSMIPDATNPMGLPSSKRGNFPGGGGAENLARAMAADGNTPEAYRQALLDFANPPHLVGFNEDAYRFLGRKLFESSVAINNNVPPDAWGCDVENHQSKDSAPGAKELLVCNLYQGVRQEMAARGLTNTKLYTYGFGQLCPVVNHTNNINDGDPNHKDIGMRRPGDMWQGNGGLMDVANPRTQTFRDGALVGGDKYLRSIWNDDSYYQKDGNGNIVTDGNGKAIYVYGNRTVTNFGHTYQTYRTEARNNLDGLYSEFDKCMTELCYLCDTNTNTYDGTFGTNMPFPRSSGIRRPGIGSLRINTFFRDNAEHLEPYDDTTGSFEPPYSTPELGIEAANQRAHYRRNIETVILLRRLVYDSIYIFSNEGNYADWVNGQANQHGGDFSSRGGQTLYYIKRRFGQFEYMAKGIHRGTNFPDMFSVMDAGKALFVIPWRPVYDANRAPAEQQTEKPFVFAIKEAGGRRLWVYWVFPSQDVGNANHNRTIDMWIQKDDNSTTGSYGLLCENRDCGFDQILLPAGCENISAENFRFKFSGLLRGPYFRTGNWNVAVSGTPVVPARVAASVVSYTLPDAS